LQTGLRPKQQNNIIHDRQRDRDLITHDRQRDRDLIIIHDRQRDRDLIIFCDIWTGFTTILVLLLDSVHLFSVQLT